MAFIGTTTQRVERKKACDHSRSIIFPSQRPLSSFQLLFACSISPSTHTVYWMMKQDHEDKQEGDDTHCQHDQLSREHEQQHQCQENEISPIVTIPSIIRSPVLQKVYPMLVSHNMKYGHPNIPLGNIHGKRCKILRRLAFENKLTEQEINLLSSMNFRFNSLEDVYDEADFDDCLRRLVEYERIHKNKFQIPKKYVEDPELGAWVTIIRRKGKDTIEPQKRRKLDEIGFSWSSQKKCGSSFMKYYRLVKERLSACSKMNDDGIWELHNEELFQETILNDDDIRKWLTAQRKAALSGNLSQSRCDYLDQLPCLDWRRF